MDGGSSGRGGQGFGQLLNRGLSQMPTQTAMPMAMTQTPMAAPPLLPPTAYRPPAVDVNARIQNAMRMGILPSNYKPYPALAYGMNPRIDTFTAPDQSGAMMLRSQMPQNQQVSLEAALQGRYGLEMQQYTGNMQRAQLQQEISEAMRTGDTQQVQRLLSEAAQMAQYRGNRAAQTQQNAVYQMMRRLRGGF